MTLGERITKLRKDLGYSQEYIAEQLSVSRQAVSKWETDQSNPDTQNLIELAKILNTSVQFLATGTDYYIPKNNETNNSKNKLRIKPSVFIISSVAFLIIGTLLVCHLLPVKYDVGACGGGFSKYIYDRYSDELVSIFTENYEKENSHIVSFNVYDWQTSYDGRKLWLTVSAVYHDSDGNCYEHSLRFKGTRIWFDTYKWKFWSYSDLY